eukprot:Sspe_Gene.29108::Locus_13617_Transcript_1_1_Confidence_1.000_Length_2346::g.29108::m.29108
MQNPPSTSTPFGSIRRKQSGRYPVPSPRRTPSSSSVASGISCTTMSESRAPSMSQTAGQSTQHWITWEAQSLDPPLSSAPNPFADEVNNALAELETLVDVIRGCKQGDETLVRGTSWRIQLPSPAAVGFLNEIGNMLQASVHLLKNAFSDQVVRMFNFYSGQQTTSLFEKIRQEPPAAKEAPQKKTVAVPVPPPPRSPATPSAPVSRKRGIKAQHTESHVTACLGSALYLLVRGIVRRLECEYGKVYVVVEKGEPAKTMLQCIAAYPLTSNDPRGVEIPLSSGSVGSVVTTGVALNVRSTRQNKLAGTPGTADSDLYSLLSFPVTSAVLSEKNIGVFQVCNKQDKAMRFTERDERIMLEGVSLISQLLGAFPLSAFTAKVPLGHIDACCLVPERTPEETLRWDEEVPPEVLRGLKTSYKEQRIYRTDSKPAYVTVSEVITAEAVVTDGSNLRDLSQQVSWMEQMWRTTLDENVAIHKECRWWQTKTAEAQARMKWIERQHQRALDCNDLKRMKLLLTQLPPEPHTMTRPGMSGKTRSYVVLDQSFDEIQSAQEKKWAAFLGAPSEDKAVQTDSQYSRKAGTSRDRRYSLAFGMQSPTSRGRPRSSRPEREKDYGLAFSVSPFPQSPVSIESPYSTTRGDKDSAALDRESMTSSPCSRGVSSFPKLRLPRELTEKGQRELGVSTPPTASLPGLGESESQDLPAGPSPDQSLPPPALPSHPDCAVAVSALRSWAKGAT